MAPNFKRVHIKAKSILYNPVDSLDGLWGPFKLLIFYDIVDYNSCFIALKKYKIQMSFETDQVLHCVKLSLIHPLFKPSVEKYLSARVPPFPGAGIAHPPMSWAPSPGGPAHLQTHISQQPHPAGGTRAAAGPGCVAHTTQARVLVQHTSPERCRFSEGGGGAPWQRECFHPDVTT